MRTRLSRLWSTAARGAGPGIWPLVAVACLVSAFGLHAAGRGDAAANGARLESITGRFDGHTAAVLIQTSEPVPYVTTEPDPLTVLVDLRNVSSAGVKNRLAGGDHDVVSAVTVEGTTAFDGAPVSRVRVSLARPLVHRVRSTRNVIRVEVDRRATAAGSSPAGADAARPSDTGETASAQDAANAAAQKPATRLQSLRVLQGPRGPIVVLQGNGALSPSSVELTKEPPYRLVLDFAGVSPAVKATTPVGKGPVNRVRVAVHSTKPLVTRVVVDLTGPVAYRVDQEGGLAISFGETAEATLAAPAAEAPAAAAAKPRPAEPPPTPVEKPPDKQAVSADLARRVKALQAQQQAAAQPPPVTPVQPPVTPVQAPPVTPVQPPVTPAQAPPVPPVQPPATPVQAPPAAPVQQPPAVPPSAPQPQAGSAQKQYTGTPISLDFAGADIRTVVRVFSEISGLNIITDPKVTGTVDVVLRDVPWDQALEIILRSAGLGYVAEGNVVRIAPLNVLAEEEKARRNLADEQALAGSLETLTRTLSYAKADEVKNVLRSSQAITKRGQVEVHVPTNTLIVRDLPGSIPIVGQIIDSLDRPQPQVEIEARIVQTTRNFARQLGVQWGFSGRVDPSLGNTTPLAFPNQGSLSGRTGAAQGQGAVPSAVSLGTTKPATGAVGMSLGSVNGAFNLDVQLSALESQGKGRILSTPRVLAQNNFKAEMTQGVQIPIQTIANNTVTVTFKDAALKLEVTPQITANQTVIMNIMLENATPDYTKQVANIPPINTQRAITQVLVKDNETIVIGGIYLSREQTQRDRTPGLHRIPLLGWLFRRDSIDEESNELLIFITPRIIKG